MERCWYSFWQATSCCFFGLHGQSRATKSRNRRTRVAPHGGPPLHVHHYQEETIHILKGRYKVRIGDETFLCEPGGFAYLPSKVPHTFLNLTDEPGEIIVVYTPGGGHKFYEEFGPLSRSGPPDPKVMGSLFEKYGMTLLGKPLSAD